jgi:hypothetical protein
MPFRQKLTKVPKACESMLFDLHFACSFFSISSIPENHVCRGPPVTRRRELSSNDCADTVLAGAPVKYRNTPPALYGERGTVSRTSPYPMLSPIAAFSSGEAIQYPYFATVPKKTLASSGVGGAGSGLDQTVC